MRSRLKLFEYIKHKKAAFDKIIIPKKNHLLNSFINSLIHKMYVPVHVCPCVYY